MKKKWMSNLSLKIASVIVAFLFWLVIINITDPTTSKTFHDIPVKILNENVITSANQVYEIEDGDTVQVTVKGKRSFVETLTETDFTATADLTELSKVNAVSIDVKLNRESNSGVEVSWDNAVLKVNLEKRVTQKFKVRVDYQGELSENYVLGEMVAKPNIVEVSCGESKFRKIDHVGVMVTLNGQSEDFEAKYTPILYDKDGDVLDDTNVTFSNNTIRVSTEVRGTKEVPIFVSTRGTPAEGYRLVQTDYKPEKVRVSGTSSALAKVETIKIQVNIDGEKKNVEREIPLADYITDGLQLEEDISTISVRCEIEKDGERTFLLAPTDVAVKNLPKNCTMNLVASSEKYTVNVTGEEQDLADLQLADLGAYVDLNGLSDGEHTLDVKFSLPLGLRVKNHIKIKIVIEHQDTDNATPIPTDVSE